MSPNKINLYTPPYWLPDGHLQTIYPSLFRKVKGVGFRRERLLLTDGDFLDLDWVEASRNTVPGIKVLRVEHKAPLVILSHGLEGSSQSQYILGMCDLLTKSGFDCLAWNFRGCSGEMNRNYRFYHSGATDDLDAVIRHAIEKGYDDISLIGFSLGGNLTLKYLGEKRKDTGRIIRKAITFCAPLDLRASSLEITRPRNYVYMKRFMKSLIAKVQEKAPHFTDRIDLSGLRNVKTLYDFDDIYTAPIHGFRNADHYYKECSSRYFVKDIQVQTLIINSQNDPIIPFRSMPKDELENNPAILFETPCQGGHCGFRPARLNGNAYWSEERALEFLQ